MSLILAYENRGLTVDLSLVDSGGDAITPVAGDKVRVIIGREGQSPKFLITSEAATVNGSLLTMGTTSTLRLDASDMVFTPGTYTLYFDYYDSADVQEWKNVSRQVFVLEDTGSSEPVELSAVDNIQRLDGYFVVGDGTRLVSEYGADARASMGVAIGEDVQAYSDYLVAMAGVTPSDGVFLVGNGSTWVGESGSVARASLGLGSMAVQNASFVAIVGGTISGITDLAVADGGTGASNAATARTNLGLGTIATQAANNVNIDGGAIDGTTIGGNTAAAGTFTTVASTVGVAGGIGLALESSVAEDWMYAIRFRAKSLVGQDGQKIYMTWQNSSGTDLWRVGQNQGGEFVIYNNEDGIHPFYAFQNVASGGHTLINAAGSGAVRVGSENGSSAGGLEVYGGNTTIYARLSVADGLRIWQQANTHAIELMGTTTTKKLNAYVNTDGNGLVVATDALVLSAGTSIQLGAGLNANGNTIYFGTAENEATISTGTNPNTCTVNLRAENHWTIPANDANNPIDATITMPPGPCGGTILIEQGATPRDITWVAGSGTIAWLGTEPTWTDASEASEIHAVSWRWNGTYLLLSDAGKTSITP